MKPKKLLQMICTGAHRHFPEPEGSQIAQRATELYHQYCQEHSADPPALKQHTEGMIYGGVALYRALQEQGLSQEEAFRQTDEILEEFVEKPAKLMRRLLNIPGLYRTIPGLFRRMGSKKYNEASGFQIKYYEEGKHRARFDVQVCPYFQTCEALGCPELTTIFCNADDTCYGNMHPKLQWNRTKTIGRGGDCCDFDLILKD